MLIRFSTLSTSLDYTNLSSAINAFLIEAINKQTPANFTLTNFALVNIDSVTGSPLTPGIYNVGTVSTVTASNGYSVQRYTKKHHGNLSMERHLTFGYSKISVGITSSMGSSSSSNFAGSYTHRVGVMNTTNTTGTNANSVFPQPNTYFTEGSIIITDTHLVVSLYAKLSGTDPETQSIMFIYADEELSSIDDDLLTQNNTYAAMTHIGSYMNGGFVASGNAPTYWDNIIWKPQLHTFANGFSNGQYYQSGYLPRNDLDPHTSLSIIPHFNDIIRPQPAASGTLEHPLVQVYSMDGTYSPIVRKIHGVYRTSNDITQQHSGDLLNVNGTQYALITNTNKSYTNEFAGTSNSQTSSNVWAFEF